MTGLTALLKIELPAHTARLCDGGVTVLGGETYRAHDSVLGSIASIDGLNDGYGPQIPALDITFAAPGAGAAAALSTGALQRSSVRLWVAEYNTTTGAVIGTPDLRFIGIIDQPQIGVAYRELTVSLSTVPEMEYLFARPTGNDLSASFHKALYPGETGHDNATGLSIPIAWGTEGPPRASSSTTYGGGYR